MVAIAFIARNPHDAPLADIPYEATLLDAQGAELRTVSGSIDVLMPGQEFGVVTEAAVASSAQVASVEIAAEPGAETEIDPDFELPEVGQPAYGANPDAPGSQPGL